MPLPRTGTTPQALNRRQAVIVWSALAAALVAAIVASAVIAAPRPMEPGEGRLMLLVISLLSIGEIIGGMVVIRSMRRTGTDAGTQTIVACGLALGVGFFAAIQHFLTRDPTFLAFAAGAAIVLVRWFPSESRWARLSGSASARGRTPMIRG